LQATYRELLQQNKRLILMWEPEFNNSYSDDAYQANDVNRVLQALNETLDEALTVNKPSLFQLQDTINSVIEEDIRASLGSSNASALLMKTKGKFDKQTYQWISEIEPAKLPKNQAAIFLNDFADNALVYHCLTLSRQRFEACRDEPSA